VGRTARLETDPCGCRRGGDELTKSHARFFVTHRSRLDRSSAILARAAVARLPDVCPFGSSSQGDGTFKFNISILKWAFASASTLHEQFQNTWVLERKSKYSAFRTVHTNKSARDKFVDDF
jgi:hypothetical protein